MAEPEITIEESIKLWRYLYKWFLSSNFLNFFSYY